MHVPWSAREVRGQLVRVSSLLLLCVSLGPTSAPRLLNSPLCLLSLLVNPQRLLPETLSENKTFKSNNHIATLIT